MAEQRFSLAIKEDKIKTLINDTLGDPRVAQKFVADISSVVGNNYALSQCTSNSIISAGLLAQALDLPLVQSLGFVALVPYENKNGYKMAQFQIGWKGLVQLAIRTNQYERIGALPVHKGEVVGIDEFGEYIIKFNPDFENQPIIGYYAYFKLLNGFKKSLYWSKEKCESHGHKYSKSYKSVWGADDESFNNMALKTVLKQLISKWGIMSVEIQKAVQADQAVIKEDGTYDYIDNPQVIEQKTTVSNSLSDEDLPFATDDNVKDAE